MTCYSYSAIVTCGHSNYPKLRAQEKSHPTGGGAGKEGGVRKRSVYRPWEKPSRHRGTPCTAFPWGGPPPVVSAAGAPRVVVVLLLEQRPSALLPHRRPAGQRVPCSPPSMIITAIGWRPEGRDGSRGRAINASSSPLGQENRIKEGKNQSFQRWQMANKISRSRRPRESPKMLPFALP